MPSKFLMQPATLGPLLGEQSWSHSLRMQSNEILLNWFHHSNKLVLDASGRWDVFRSPSFTASKGENFSIFSTKDIAHITGESDYHSAIAGLALLEVRFGAGGGGLLICCSTQESALVTTRYPSHIKQTPKSQHDILSMLYCYSFCQRSAHLNSWLVQRLETHPLLEYSLLTSLALSPVCQEKFFHCIQKYCKRFPCLWKDNNSFVSDQCVRHKPRKSSSHTKHL